MTAPRTWAQVLDVLESTAAAVEAVLVDPDHEPSILVQFAPPAGLGPMPIELRGRAEAAYDRLRAAEDQLRARCELVNQELVLVTGSRTPTVARYVDTHA